MRALDYLTGLLAPLEMKNGWTLSEQVGQLRPDSVQRLLNHSDWDENAVRDDIRDFVVETIGSADGVLICDDTGFLKKGTKSAGVQRQYSGTAGPCFWITVRVDLPGGPRRTSGLGSVPGCGRAIRTAV